MHVFLHKIMIFCYIRNWTLGIYLYSNYIDFHMVYFKNVTFAKKSVINNKPRKKTFPTRLANTYSYAFLAFFISFSRLNTLSNPLTARVPPYFDASTPTHPPANVT